MAQLPFGHSPKIARRNARLHRLKRKGLTSTDKASLRIAADHAAAIIQPTIIQPGKRTRSRQD